MQGEKNLCPNLFLIKLQAGNLKLSEVATGDVLSKVFLRISQILQESLFSRVVVLRACNFIEKDSETDAFLWTFPNF